MCRLAIVGGIQKVEPLITAFTQLEKSMGGDGNGVWNSELGEITKGVNLTPKEIAELVAGSPGYNIFHTRMSTAGGVRDEICHPFDAGEWVVAHNGHWSGWFGYAEGTISDTQTAAKLVKEYGPGVLLNREFDHSGVWIVGAEEGAFILHRGWNNFYLQPLKHGGFFHASEGVKNFARKGVYMVPKNSIHFITDDDMYETVLQPTEMPDPVYDVADYYGSRYTSYTSYGTGSGNRSNYKSSDWSSVYSYDDTFDFDEAEWEKFETALVAGDVTSWREYVEMRKWENEVREEWSKEAGAYEDDEEALSEVEESLGIKATNFNAGSEEQLALPEGSEK